MTESRSNPVCPRCAQPIRHDSLVLFRHGELFHLACRSQTLELEAMEQVERATQAQAEARQLLTQVRRHRSVVENCPICGMTATVTDWRPGLAWVAVADCPCAGYFLWAPLLRRLLDLGVEDRESLSHRIHDLRATGSEAWVSMRHGTPEDPSVVVRDHRPDRAP